jgi:hypothetical protein
MHRALATVAAAYHLSCSRPPLPEGRRQLHRLYPDFGIVVSTGKSLSTFAGQEAGVSTCVGLL